MDSKCLRWLRIVYLPLLWEECVISYKARALFYYCYAGVCRYLQGDNRQLTRVFLCPSASLLPSASADGLKDLEAKPLPLWVFNPFHRLHLKGLKPTKEPAKPGTITYPSAEADGKREAAAWGLPHLNLIGAGGIGHSQRAVRLYFRHRVFSFPAKGFSVLGSVFYFIQSISGTCILSLN